MLAKTSALASPLWRIVRVRQSTLGKAIALWKSGRNITFHMARELIEQGYDVAALAKERFGLSMETSDIGYKAHTFH